MTDTKSPTMKSTKAKTKTVTVHINPALKNQGRFTVGRGKYGGEVGDTFEMPGSVFEKFQEWAVDNVQVLVKGKGPEPERATHLAIDGVTLLYADGTPVNPTS